MKTFLLVLYKLANIIIPIILVLAFVVGVYFNLIKVQMLQPAIAIPVCLILGGLLVFAFGKLIKLW